MSAAAEAAAIPLRVPGVVSSDISMSTDTVTVVFDDARTDIVVIRDALRKEGFPVREEPRIVEPQAEPPPPGSKPPPP